MTATDRPADDLHTIDVWLAGHAPASHGALRPGLDKTDLATLESGYGFDLHPELRALLTWHNGCERVDQGFDIWPDFMFENSADLLERSRGPHHRWSPHWVPIASDLGLNMLVVDHRTPSGEVRLYDGVDGPRDNPVSPSIGSLMAQVSHALTNGVRIEGRMPTVKDGYLIWE